MPKETLKLLDTWQFWDCRWFALADSCSVCHPTFWLLIYLTKPWESTNIFHFSGSPYCSLYSGKSYYNVGRHLWGWRCEFALPRINSRISLQMQFVIAWKLLLISLSIRITTPVRTTMVICSLMFYGNLFFIPVKLSPSWAAAPPHTIPNQTGTMVSAVLHISSKAMVRFYVLKRLSVAGITAEFSEKSTEVNNKILAVDNLSPFSQRSN